MSTFPPLPDTLDRLDRLLAETSASRDEELRIDDLAFRTALPEATVRTLLNRETVPEDTVEERVCARIAAIGAAYITVTGKRAADVRREVAVAMGRSTEWARQLLAGQSVPNLSNFVALRSYFDEGLRLDLDAEFFTAPAEEALSRALQPIVQRLGGHDPLEAALAEMKVRSIDHRAKDMSSRQREALAEFIRAVVAPGEAGQ